MNSKKLKNEFKIGTGILCFYLLWFFVWVIYSALEGSAGLLLGDMTKELIPPFEQGYFLGTDIYGRSILNILSEGLSYSLGIAFLVSLTSSVIGIIVGYLSVTGSKFVKITTDLTTNLIFVFPSILIAIMVMSVIGQSFWGLVFALIVTGWPGYARISRGETMRVMGLSYVESAQAVGMGKTRLFLSVILPAILPFVLVHVILGLSGVIISEASLGFLGLGGSEYSWGAMLAMGKTTLLEAPFIVIILSIVMAGLIIGLNLVGDGLRDYLDPYES